jgi:hypothetical protein
MTEIANKIGYVYKIVCLDPEIKDCYVGSCQSFRTRKCDHKTVCNNSNSKKYNLNVYSFIRAHGGWANWSMIAIEQVEYTIKHELLVRERFHLEHLNASLNKQIPTRTDQQYREDHKTEIKQYREDHKTEAKQYRETNKTQISEKAKQKITCECGKSFTKHAIPYHNKTRYHQNYLANLPEIEITEVPR